MTAMELNHDDPPGQPAGARAAARETRRRAPIVAMPRAAGSPRRHESGRLIQRSRLQGTKARDAAGEDASTLHLVLVFLKLAERVLDVLQRDDPAGDEGRHG